MDDILMTNLRHGDCLKEMKKLKTKSIDVSFTSPPYNRKANDKYENYNDNVKNYYGWMCDVIDELLRVTKGFIFFNIQKNRYNKKDVFKLIGKYNSVIQEIIIWKKSNPQPSNSEIAITNAYEFFLVLGNSPLKSNIPNTQNIITTSIYSFMPKNHKAVMNPKICKWFIERFTKKDDIILDCFMGLGTTGIICKKLNRSFIGIELDKEYFSTATRNIANILGIQEEIEWGNV